MSIKIKDVYRKQSDWNDMEELKYLICAIDNSKCPPSVPSPSCSIILPPRIEEIPCESPPRRPPSVPPPPCCPITPGPCCPQLLPPSILPATLPQPLCNTYYPCNLSSE